MYKKINPKNIIVNMQGAIIVEFVFVVFITTLFIKILLSVSEYYSTVGKLDRISYSLVGVVRERTRLYNNDNVLTQAQVNEIKKLADSMLANSHYPQTDLAIKIETIHFRHTDSSEIENRHIDDEKSFSFNIGVCEPDESLNELSQLSSFSLAGRWIPLYQVTLCLPTTPWYRVLFKSRGNIAPIKSSSIAMER
ncbi:pseudopilin [Yersinia kristensenii]|nr:pseudopilin [Yersinia kristensenii]